MLNVDRDRPTMYLEAEEVVLKMSGEEARDLKKYLVYLYKWIINSNGKTSIITEDLHNHLKKVVVDKIYEGSQQ